MCGFIYLKSGEDFTIAGSKTHVDPGQDDDSNGEGGTIQIESGQDLTITGTMNANGKGKGKGGKILLRAEEKLTRSNTVLHADGGCLGYGGVITSSGDSVDYASGIATAKAGDGNCGLLRSFVNSQGTRGGDYTLEVRGSGSSTLELIDDIDVTGLGPDGAGGSVFVSTPGAFSFGSFSIKADGTTGGGGMIKIECGSDLSVNSSKVSAAAGSGNGDGGHIEVNVRKNSSSGILTLSGNFDVSGHGTGTGGTLKFAGESGVVLTPSGLSLTSDGGDDSGAGGQIYIYSQVEVDFSEITDEIITANGKGDNRGGKIEITRAKSERNGVKGIDVRRIMNVDGGPDLAPGEVDGSISLNNVVCAQIRTTLYPVNFWVSTKFTEQTLELPNFASDLHPILIDRLKAQEVGLYVHDSPVRMAQYFGQEKIEGPSGETFQIVTREQVPSLGLPIYVNAFLHTGKPLQEPHP